MPRQKKKALFLCQSPVWPAYLEKVTCEEPCEPVGQFTLGTMIGSVSTCTNRHSSQWESQECPTFSQLVAWCPVESTQRSACAYFDIFQCPQSLHQPSTKSSQPLLFQHFCLPGISVRLSCSTTLTLGGDAGCDSPGFPAKFGSYTLIDLETGKLVDFQLVQVNMTL